MTLGRLAVAMVAAWLWMVLFLGVLGVALDVWEPFAAAVVVGPVMLVPMLGFAWWAERSAR